MLYLLISYSGNTGPVGKFFPKAISPTNNANDIIAKGIVVYQFSSSTSMVDN